MIKFCAEMCNSNTPALEWGHQEQILDRFCWALVTFDFQGAVARRLFFMDLNENTCFYHPSNSKVLHLPFFFFFFLLILEAHKIQALRSLLQATAASGNTNTSITKVSPCNGRWSPLISTGEIHRTLEPLPPWAKRKSPSTSEIFLTCNPNIIKVWRLEMGNP